MLLKLDGYEPRIEHAREIVTALRRAHARRDSCST